MFSQKGQKNSIVFGDPFVTKLRNSFKKMHVDLNKPELNWKKVSLNELIVLTPLVGEGSIYSNGFLFFSQFWPIDIHRRDRYSS